jgi:excisionase family DNA binding protein
MREAGLTYTDIGLKFGISRERVRQIVKEKDKVDTKPDNPAPHPWLKTSDVAHLVNVHVNTVRRWAKQGVLKAYYVGSRGDMRFKQEDVNRLFKERTTS